MEEHVDLRIQKTHFLLHRAFTELMEEQGFEAFTVGQLCERAMIRRATFYKHFADKYEYFSFYMKEIFGSFHSRLMPGMEAQDVNAYALHMCRELIHFVKEHERFVRKAMEASVAPTTLTILLEVLHSDIQHALRNAGRTGLSDTQLEGQALFFTGGVLSILYRYLQSSAPIDEEEFMSIVSGFLFPET
jgi:AcrR family transcriptional regulator